MLKGAFGSLGDTQAGTHPHTTPSSCDRSGLQVTDTSVQMKWTQRLKLIWFIICFTRMKAKARDLSKNLQTLCNFCLRHMKNVLG